MAAPHLDTSTIRVARDRPPGPPPLWWFVPLSIPLALVLYTSSFPGMAYFVTLAALFGLAIAGVAWLIRFLLWWRGGDRSGAIGWLPIPVVVVAVLVVGYLRVPLQLRFDASRGDFDAARESSELARSSDWVCEDGGTVGSYRIDRVCRAGDVFVFYEANGNGMDSAGFIFLPDGPDAPTDRLGLLAPDGVRNSLGGGWHRYVIAG